MRIYILYVLLILLNCSSYALEKEELLKLIRPDEAKSDNLIVLNSDYIDENPQRAIQYHNQAIEQIKNMPFKAFYLLQNGVIYNYYYNNKKDSALKSIIDATCALDIATFNLFLSKKNSLFLGSVSLSDEVIEIIFTGAS